jgi:hypothetical protein
VDWETLHLTFLSHSNCSRILFAPSFGSLRRFSFIENVNIFSNCRRKKSRGLTTNRWMKLWRVAREIETYFSAESRQRDEEIEFSITKDQKILHEDVKGSSAWIFLPICVSIDCHGGNRKSFKNFVCFLFSLSRDYLRLLRIQLEGNVCAMLTCYSLLRDSGKVEVLIVWQFAFIQFCCGAR